MNRLLNRANKRISLGSAATLLIVVALFSQGLGFIRTRLLATNFTNIDGGLSDAFFWGFLIPDFFYYTIAAGALGVAFMPVIADKIAARNKQAIWELTSSLMNTLILAMGLVALIILIFAPVFVRTLAGPTLTPDHQYEAVMIMRLLAFNPMIFSLSGILVSVQQSYGRFFFYALTSPVYNITVICSILLFRNNVGIIGVGIGALVGAILQLLVACCGLIGMDFKWQPRIKWNSPDFKGILHRLPPRSLDQGIDQINGVVEFNRAQKLYEGAVSHYSYASALHMVPIMLFGNAIATAAFPRLTERLSQGRPDLLRKDFLNILQIVLWLTAPVLVVSFFCRGYLARLLFGQSAQPISIIFGFLVVAILFRIIYAMLSRYFYAHKDTRTPLLVSIFAIALNIILVFRLANPNSYGVAGLALAQSLVAASEVALLAIIMVKRDPKLINRDFWDAILRIISVSGFTIVTAYLMLKLLPLQAADRGFVTLGSKLFIIAAATFLTHTALSALFGMAEAKYVLRKLRQLILRPVKVEW